MKQAMAAVAPRVGMGRRVRMGAGAVAASALTAALVLTAAPASAAPTTAAAPTTTSITEQSCAVQGGTFTRSKGVKTCTIGPSYIRYTAGSTGSAEVYGPFTNPFLTADGYVAEWRYADGYRDTVVQTQKGGGAVVTTTTSVLVYRATTDHTCFALTYYPHLGGYGYGSAFTVLCDIAGLYPATIDLRG